MTKFIKLFIKLVHLSLIFCPKISGLYYKHITIVNYNSSAVNKFGASLTDDTRVVIYNRHMFIVQATGLRFCNINWVLGAKVHYSKIGRVNEPLKCIRLWFQVYRSIHLTRAWVRLCTSMTSRHNMLINIFTALKNCYFCPFKTP